MLPLLLLAGWLLPGVTGSAYDPALSQQLVHYTAASYCSNRSALAAWSCTQCSPPGSSSPSLSSVAVLWNATTQVQGYAGYSAAAGRIIVAFRGSVGALDWWEDFDFALAPGPPACGAGCRVSHGFYHTCFLSIYPALLQALGALTARYGSVPLHLTGHSLGAAITQLVAFELATTSQYSLASVITYGTPRVGDAQWAAAYEKALSSTPAFRVVHYRDPVPHLPFEDLGYLHPPTEVFYDSETGTTWKECSATNGEDNTCSDSVL